MAEVPLIGAPKESPEETPGIVEAETAFLVYVLEDGSVGMTPDLNLPVVAKNTPSPQDIWVALSTAKRNIEATEIAVQAAQITLSNIPQALMQFQRQLQEQMQNQALVGQLGSLK